MLSLSRALRHNLFNVSIKFLLFIIPVDTNISGTSLSVMLIKMLDIKLCQVVAIDANLSDISLCYINQKALI